MAGTLQLIARLQAAPVPPVPSPHSLGEPLEAAPLLEVPPVPPVPPQFEQISGRASAQPDHDGPVIHTAATAPAAWVAARDAYIGHLMPCRACHAPTGRHCPAGAELRAIYDRTPWSIAP